MTGGKVSEEGECRLDAMIRTTDGFQIGLAGFSPQLLSRFAIWDSL